MKPIVELIRLEENEKFGTFGMLKIQKEIFCATLEPNDMENQQNISSIPAQQYTCKRYSSAKYSNTFEVMNVPGRTGILFHPGNKSEDTAGCILLGMYSDYLNKVHRQLFASVEAFGNFTMVLAKYDEFNLTIIEVY